MNSEDRSRYETIDKVFEGIKGVPDFVRSLAYIENTTDPTLDREPLYLGVLMAAAEYMKDNWKKRVSDRRSWNIARRVYDVLFESNEYLRSLEESI